MKQTNSNENDKLPADTINGNFSAVPHDDIAERSNSEAAAMEAMDYGDASLEDAKESGYTDAKGHAISMSKKDIEGHPTGAYTDIGSGISSAVISKEEFLKSEKLRHH